MKKKQPFDDLTEQDKYAINRYIFLYGNDSKNCNCGPLETVLQEWNKCKRRLYHAMGNQLRIKKKIVLATDNTILQRKLIDIYRYHPVYHKYDISTLKYYINKDKNHPFYKDFLMFVINKEDLLYSEKKAIINLFRYKHIINGYVECDDCKFINYSFSIRNGAKTIRTIQKCIKALGYQNIQLFNDWRNKVNTVNSNNLTTFNIVISIHPLDFMTMSDNNCNWSSCMSWIKQGSYNAGTIEMMNSNIAAIAYIESDKPFIIPLDSEHEINISNKSWRSLLFCNKYIIVAGKSYPYHQDRISKEVVKFMRETVEQTVHWKYVFKEQLYRDMIHFHNNEFLKYDCLPDYNNHKKIILYTNGMYNDMIEDTGCNYWCARNPIEGKKFSVSGKLTCLCCGKPIYPPQDIYEHEQIAFTKICNCCYGNACPICGTINYQTDNEYNLCSEMCKNDAIIFPGQKRVISKIDFLNNSEKKSIFIFAKDVKTKSKIYNILNEVIDCFPKNKTSRFVNKHIKLILNKNNLIEGIDYKIKLFSTYLINNGLTSSVSGVNYILFTDNPLVSQIKIFTEKLEDVDFNFKVYDYYYYSERRSRCK